MCVGQFNHQNHLGKGLSLFPFHAPPDSPVIYSRTTSSIPESSRFTVGQLGAPDSPVCQAELEFGCTQPSLFHCISSSVGPVSIT
jgi:hypothetical protein